MLVEPVRSSNLSKLVHIKALPVIKALPYMENYRIGI